MSLRIFIALFLALSSTASAAQTADPATSPTTALTAVAGPAEDIGAALVQRLADICARHPEVERAFVLVQPGKDGSPTYTFVPIFDRKVADEVLSEAQAAYHELAPDAGYLPLLLLTRNTWKKVLGSAPPIYLRPHK